MHAWEAAQQRGTLSTRCGTWTLPPAALVPYASQPPWTFSTKGSGKSESSTGLLYWLLSSTCCGELMQSLSLLRRLLKKPAMRESS